MSVILPGFGPISRVELNAIKKFRRVKEQENCTQSNECFSSLFAWGGEQRQVSKSVEVGNEANQCFDSCFPHL